MTPYDERRLRRAIDEAAQVLGTRRSDYVAVRAAVDHADAFADGNVCDEATATIHRLLGALGAARGEPIEWRRPVRNAEEKSNV